MYIILDKLTNFQNIQTFLYVEFNLHIYADIKLAPRSTMLLYPTLSKLITKSELKAEIATQARVLLSGTSFSIKYLEKQVVLQFRTYVSTKDMCQPDSFVEYFLMN